jgi:hypothetical protein
VKDLGSLSSSCEWPSQLLNDDNPDLTSLATNFNIFLGSITSHFQPQKPPTLPIYGPIYHDLLASEYKVLNALTHLKTRNLLVLT